MKPHPSCPAAEHDDTNAECICSQFIRLKPQTPVRFEMAFNTENDAFVNGPYAAIAKVLSTVAQHVEQYGATGVHESVYDENGNPIGTYKVHMEDA